MISNFDTTGFARIHCTGDGFINAQGDPGTSVANIGTADHRVGYFEAHTTFGKDDYGVAILQANEGNTVNLYADKAILDGSTNKNGGVIGTGGFGTVNVNTKDLTIDGNICGTYGGRNDPNKTASLNIVTDTLHMKGDVNIGSAGSGSSNFSRNTEVNIKAATSFINVAAIFYISVNFLDFYNGKCFRMNDLRAVKRSEEISLRWLPA